jgi:hypothetical protein
MLIVIMQYTRHNIFGTWLLLGWDSPNYVWLAKNVITSGPMYLARVWSYPNLYVQSLAFLAYLTGDVLIVERILPLLFGVLLIYMNARLTFTMTNNIHVAGLAALFTSLSINALRLLADLHRNLMALVLSFIVLLIVTNLDYRRSLVSKGYIFLVFLLTIIASTSFETFFVLCITLLVYSVLVKNAKRLASFILACAIPTVVLALLFPRFFLAYTETVQFWSSKVGSGLTLNLVLLWLGGSWILFGFFIIGIGYLSHKAVIQNNKPALSVFSWVIVIILLVGIIQLRIIPLSQDFSTRALIIMPVPILLSLAVSACTIFVKERTIEIGVYLSKRKYLRRVSMRLLLFCLAFLLIFGSGVIVSQNADNFLTPYIPRSGYDKIVKATDYIRSSGLRIPVFVFYGDSAVWHTYLYRSYIGMEIGEHFAYYGQIENLLRLVRTETQSSDPLISEMENQQSMVFYLEMLGNPITPLYYHESYINSVEALMAHPIVIITPEFFNGKIPFYIKPFYVEEGIYIIPSNSVLKISDVVYGPAITLVKNGIPTQVRSEYLYIDPVNSNIIHLQVNGSTGYSSYNFTDFPSDWEFEKIEQAGDISFPEYDPMRINGTKASINNDPADSTKDWSTLWPEQNGSFEIETSSRKEGLASLKVAGKTDSWGNLGVRYDSLGTWDLSKVSLMGLWAKTSETAPFSMTMYDSSGRLRVFYALRSGESRLATSLWKRFVAELDNYTSQTDGFDIGMVDFIDFYISSGVGKSVSFWIDDLTIDNVSSSKGFIYKSRVLVDEAVVAYFSFYINKDHDSLSP